VIVPGHGLPLHDKTLLETHLALLRELMREGRAAKSRGLNVEEARAEVMDSVRDLRIRLTGDAPGLNDAFGLYLVDWFLHRVYDEENGPLTDDIAPIPAH
jgi:hypothetical protein